MLVKIRNTGQICQDSYFLLSIPGTYQRENRHMCVSRRLRHDLRQSSKGENVVAFVFRTYDTAYFVVGRHDKDHSFWWTTAYHIYWKLLVHATKIFILTRLCLTANTTTKNHRNTSRSLMLHVVVSTRANEKSMESTYKERERERDHDRI